MGARDKLNTVVVWGCLIVSALVGAVMGSWGAFWLTLVVTIAGCYSAGGIRTPSQSRHAQAGRVANGGRPPSRGRRR